MHHQSMFGPAGIDVHVFNHCLRVTLPVVGRHVTNCSHVSVRI